MDMSKNETPKPGLDLISYQLGELKNLVSNLDIKMDKNQENAEKRIQSLELWRAAIDKQKENPPLDIQKIILAAFGIISGAIALSLAALQTGALK